MSNKQAEAGAEAADLSIAPDGQVSRWPVERASTEAGPWALWPSSGDVVVMERARGRRGAGRVVLTGLIDGPDALLGLLNLLAMNQESGELRVVSDGAERSLYFSRGQLLSGASNRPEDRLGALLVREGALSGGQLAEVLAGVDDSTRFGRELVRRGLMTTPQVYEAVRRQTVAIFTAVLFLRRGVFYLRKPVDMSRVPAMFHLDMQELMLDGLRQVDELNHLRSIIPSLEVVLRRLDHTPRGEATPVAARLLAELDGQTPLGALMATLHLDELTASRAAAELLQQGCAEVIPVGELVRPTPNAGTAAEQVIDVYEDAIQCVLAAGSPAQQQGLAASVSLFLVSNATYADLLTGVALAEEGRLDRRRLIENALGRQGGGDGPTERLQRCLNELLFFLLFELGHHEDRAMVEEVRRQVARCLARLTTARAPARVGELAG